MYMREYWQYRQAGFWEYWTIGRGSASGRQVVGRGSGGRQGGRQVVGRVRRVVGEWSASGRRVVGRGSVGVGGGTANEKLHYKNNVFEILMLKHYKKNF